ncbi:MAG: alpha/beta fold hydrolase [Bacillota bacterium]
MIPTKTLKVSATVAVFFLIALSGFWIYVESNTYPADETFLSRIEDMGAVSITDEGDHYTISPGNSSENATPIVFYPGGLVDPRAYLYKMGRVAEHLSSEIYVIKPPFGLAIFRIDAATSVMMEHGLDRAWIGGHSLGGIAACRFTSSHPDRVAALYLLASYCDRDLDDFDGPVVSIMGDSDWIIDRDNYRDAKSNLPPGAVVQEIEGLNHSAFGNYGKQAGDGPGTLDDEQVIELLISSFEEIRRTSSFHRELATAHGARFPCSYSSSSASRILNNSSLEGMSAIVCP